MQQSLGKLPLYAVCSLLSCLGVSQTCHGQQFVSARTATPKPLSAAGQSLYRTVLGVADFNHDGNLDVLAYYSNPDSTASGFGLLLGDGKGNFTGKPIAGLPSLASAQVGDVNGDGKPDIVTVISSDNDPKDPTNPPSTINVYLGNGDGTFRALPPVTINLLPATIVLLRDLNGDGKLDLITDSPDYGSQSDDFQVFFNDGAGVFHAGNVIPGSSGSGTHIFDGAGRFYPNSKGDLILTTDNGLQVYKNDGHGNFTGEEVVATASSGVTVGDFNKDGYDDLLVTSAPSPNGNGSSVAMLCKGDGAFRKTASLDTSYFNWSITNPTPGYVADFNHDGKNDLAFFSVGETGMAIVGVFPGKGNGTFGNPNVYNLGTENYGGFAVGDFNRDGYLDLLTSNAYGYSLATGTKSGVFNAAKVTLSPNTASIAVADFNHDGISDVATANLATCTTCTGKVGVFAGTGKGYFESGKFYSIGQKSGVIVAGDLNGDGKIDLVVVRSKGVVNGAPSGAAYDLSVLLDSGSGEFEAAKNYKLLGAPASGNVATTVFLADANHDGKPDLIGDWGVALGNGNGTFKKPIPLPSGIANIVAIGTADFAHSGQLDLAVASSGSGSTPASIYILMGNGDGSFRIADQQGLGASSSIGSLATAELDDSGATYLIFTGATSTNNVASTSLWVERVSQLGAIASTNRYAITSTPAAGSTIAVVDFNSDGKKDVLVSGADGNGDLELWFGLGDGSLSTKTQFFNGAINFLVPIELDGNSSLDVVGAASWPDYTIAVAPGIERLLNSGAKTSVSSVSAP